MMLRAAFVPPMEAVEDLRALAGRIGMLPGVHPLPSDRLDVRIAGMGNVAEADVQRLVRNIEAWPVPAVLPEVWWSGVSVQTNGDVGVHLTGDLAGLADIARAVGKSAEKVHVYVDRRAFQPLAVIATVDEQRPGSRVLSALGELGTWEGSRSWRVADVALIRIRWFAGAAVSEIVERVWIPSRGEAEQHEQV